MAHVDAVFCSYVFDVEKSQRVSILFYVAPIMKWSIFFTVKFVTDISEFNETLSKDFYYAW